MRRALPLLLVPALLLAACGDSEDTIDTSEQTTTPDGGAEPTKQDIDALDGVTVTGADGEQPVLEFDKPLSVGATVRRVLDEGDTDGEEVVDGATVSFDFVFINAPRRQRVRHLVRERAPRGHGRRRTCWPVPASA